MSMEEHGYVLDRGRGHVVEVWEAVEATGEPYRLPRSFRWPRRIVERP